MSMKYRIVIVEDAIGDYPEDCMYGKYKYHDPKYAEEDANAIREILNNRGFKVKVKVEGTT